MTTHTEHVLREALQLPEEERAELVCGLIDSFGVPEAGARADEEWIAEVERRARAAMAGEPGIPWEGIPWEVGRGARRSEPANRR